MFLKELARVIRSKNAGPRCITLDVLFENDDAYRRVVQSDALSREAVAQLYGVTVSDVRVFHHPIARAIKIAMPRKITAGDPGDRDVYGAQQHGRLLEVRV